MKNKFFISLLLLLLIAPASEAKLKVKCDVKEISRHQLLVTLSWDVTVHSDKEWDACDLIITLRDNDDNALYTIKERLELKVGMNSFTGHEICEIRIWQRTTNYVAKLDCVF